MKIDTCVQGDSLKWMQSIKTPFADLIIADPPFNIGFQYDSYNDDRPEDDYLAWCKSWIGECKRLLDSEGNLLICISDKHVSDIDVLCRKELGLTRANWIVWHYQFGQSGNLDTRKRFTCSKTHILRYVKNKKFFFDAGSVAVPSARQLAYNDKRADSRGKCPNDVFTFKRIAGTHKARVDGIATQMPVELLRIWVKAMCRPGGCVFDPFAGSGSSLIAAEKESRHYLGVELSPNYHKIIMDQLAAL